MNKLYSLVSLLIVLLFTHEAYAQNIIYSEDFNNASNTFSLNSGGPGTNTGPNNWIVDSMYSGNGVYPNTPNQSQTSGGGGISGAPHSQYLHIHDSNSPSGALNANYDTSQASDNFAQMGGDVCTLGYDSVHFVFYYIAEGNVNDYGRLYYSIDGGNSWVLIAPPSPLNNTSLWKYVIVSNPIFANQTTLRFGFRWTNTGASPPKDVSIGVDDIFVVGYENPTHVPKLSISNVSPTTVCLGGSALVTIKLTKPLCDGNYNIALSNPDGNFNGGVISFSVFMPAGDSTESFFLNFPSSLARGTCYKLNVARTTAPFITGNSTACFTLKNCGDSIQTLQPVVLYGPDTACTKSVIDVPFWSYGKYYNGNTYIAELSNPDGTFPAVPTSSNLIGQSSGDSTTYDPSMVPSPGTVSGLIPDVPPGCNYYIRVISTNPATVPITQDYYGPFCLRRCDILTDSTNSVHVCVTPTTGDDTTITLTINQWNNNAQYAPGDSFLVQIIDSKTYAVLNTGSFGYAVVNKNGTITLTVPDLPQVIALLGAPGTGMYYLRLIAKNSSTPWNTLGTLIHLVIGSINPPGTLDVSDTLLCVNAGGTVFFFADPPNTSSQYQWEIDPRIVLNGIPPGKPFYSPYPPPYEFGIGFPPNSLPQGYYWFTVREVNNGCFSPWFDSAHVRVIPTPNVIITGPSPVCEKDTMTFKVNFTNDTYYQWTTTAGRLTDTSNNTLQLMFDSTGQATLTVNAINQCGSANGTKTVTIEPKPVAKVSADTTVCPNQPVTLWSNGSVAGGTVTYKWTEASDTVSKSNSFTVSVESKQTYVVSVISNEGCKDKDSVTVNIFQVPRIKATSTDVTCYGEANGTASLTPSNGTPPYQIDWNTTPEQNTLTINNLGVGDYNVIVTDANNCSADTSVMVHQPDPVSVSLTSEDVTYGGTDGSAMASASGGTPPYTYQWSTDPVQNGNTIVDLGPGSYAVTVTDAEGCTAVAFIVLSYKSDQIYVPNAFSPNGDGNNDVFNYFGNNIKDVYMAIYDRWGEMLFETDNLNVYWDGTYKGKPQSEGAYAYYIKVTFLDGTGKLVKGNVTLIRQ